MRIISFLFCVFLSASAAAQNQYIVKQPTKAELDARRKEIQDEINETQQQLEGVKSNKKATLGELSALQNKLALRQRQIGNINDELSDIDNTIKSSSREIGTMKQNLQMLKMRYAQSIRYAYTTRSSYSMLAYLFSSHDFNDAMRRMKYLKRFRDIRKEQVDQIRNTQTRLQKKIGTLNSEKAQQAELLTEQVQKKQELVQETQKTNEVIQELKGKENELLKKIEKNRKETQRLNKMVQEVIEREMAKAAKLADEEAAKHKGTAATTGKPDETAPTAPGGKSVTKGHRAEVAELLLTPKDAALASNFEGNRGKLYWPVDKGYIIDRYGTHPHPVHTGVMINNNGIDIQTASNASVKAVFEGTVSSVVNMGGSQMVMVQHGNYFTVYNNLSSVSVTKGQHVNTNQSLGSVGEDDDGVPVINFQVWKNTGGGKKGSASMNPESWIGRAH